QRMICSPSLWRKAGNGGTDVRIVEGRSFVDLAGEEALPQWAVWNEANAEFFKGYQYFCFRASPPQGIFTLNGCDCLDGMGTANRLCASFRHAEVPDLPGLNQILHSPSHVLDWHVWVNTVLVVQIDGFDP